MPSIPTLPQNWSMFITMVMPIIYWTELFAPVIARAQNNRPRANLIRYHGVLAPNSKFRSVVTPAKRGKGSRSKGSDKEISNKESSFRARRSLTWAQRLKRVFNIDINICHHCGGAVKIIACIESPVVIKRILDHLEAQSCKVGPSGQLIAIDLDDSKLAMAKHFGATHLINANETDPVAEIHKLTSKPGQITLLKQPVTGVDYAFDCIGLRKTMGRLLPACRGGHFGVCKGGAGVVLGIPTTPVELDANDMVIYEKQFMGSVGGSCRPERDFPTFLQWYNKGELDLASLVTARYRLEDINQAIEALAKGQIVGRAIIEFDH